MANTVHFNIVSAEKTRTRLLESLGTENNDAQWIVFMDTVAELIPFVLGSSGAPSKSDVASSFIAALGFSGWYEMLQANVEEGGFGLKLDKYKDWRRAYKILVAHPFIREIDDVSPGRVKKLGDTFGSNSEAWPNSIEELEAKEAAVAAEKETKKRELNAYLQKQCKELDDSLSKANEKLAQYKQRIEELQKQSSSMMNLVSDFKSLSEKLSATERDLVEQQQINNQLNTELNVLNEKVEVLSSGAQSLIEENKQLKSCSRLGYLRKFFVGS